MSNRTAEATLPLSAQPTRQVAVIDIGTSSIRMAVAEINAAGQVPFDRDLKLKLRDDYRNFIADDLPILAETIGARWLAVAPGSVDPAAGGFGTGGWAAGVGRLTGYVGGDTGAEGIVGRPPEAIAAVMGRGLRRSGR